LGVSTLLAVGFVSIQHLRLDKLVDAFFLRHRDRSNIGNAKIARMATDLKLVGLKYNIAAAVFFVSIWLTHKLLDVGGLTHVSSDTLQPYGSTIVRYNSKCDFTKITDFPETLHSNFFGHQDGVSSNIFPSRAASRFDLTSQFPALWSHGA
jgi:hypothetical protein